MSNRYIHVIWFSFSGKTQAQFFTDCRATPPPPTSIINQFVNRLQCFPNPTKNLIFQSTGFQSNPAQSAHRFIGTASLLLKHCCCFAHLQRHLHCGGHPPEPPAPPSSTRRRARRARRPPRGATRGAIIATWDVLAAGPFRGAITALWPLTSLCHCILTPF